MKHTILKSDLFHRIIITLSIAISSAIPFISSFGKFIGEPFDTRFQIVVHEHWYWFFNGERPLRDVYIFYPFDTTLGFSDIFFANGFIYSLIRFLNFEILTAWTLTNFIVIILGNIGLALLLVRILKSTLLIILAIFTFSNSFTFIALLNIWPNSVGYILVSWVLLFLYQIYNSDKNITFWVNCYLIFIPILSLSYWYPGFFSIIGTILFIFLISLRQSRLLVYKFKLLFEKENLIKLGLFAPFWVGLWGIFVFIVSPTSDNLRRSKDEIYKGSLDLSNFFAVDSVGPTFLSDSINKFATVGIFSGNQDWSIGYPLLTIITFAIISIRFRIELFKLDNLRSFTFFAVVIALLLTMRTGESGVYVFLWQTYDILGIIRTPLRINILINFLMLLLIFKNLDQIISSGSFKKKFIFIILLLIICLDQFRFLPATWSKKDFINKDLISQVNSIKANCSYFVLVNEGAGHWSDTMDGMVLSALTNVPTINGYSGTSPSDGIQRSWDQPSKKKYAFEYIDRNSLSGDGCIVSNVSISRLTELDALLIYDNMSESFWESTKNKSWKWIETNFFTFEIRNPFTYQEIPPSSIQITMAPCQVDLSLIVLVDQQSQVIELNRNNPSVSLNFNQIPPNESIEVDVKSNKSGCFVGDDPRPLIYALEIIK